MKTINVESIQRTNKGFHRDFINHVLNLTPIREEFIIQKDNHQFVYSVEINYNEEDLGCVIKIKEITEII